MWRGEVAEYEEKNLERNEIHQLEEFESLSNETNEIEVTGQPAEMAAYYHEQHDAFSCALYAQESALEAAGEGRFDIDGVIEDSVVENADREGWYDPEAGTKVEDVGRLWESRGYDVDRSQIEGASITDGPEFESMRSRAFIELESDLSGGKAVVATVETKYLGPAWHGEAGGHAEWVTGIEHRADGDWIICNDSGLGDGEGRAIPYRAEDFDRAWRQFDYYKVSTRDPIFGRG